MTQALRVLLVPKALLDKTVKTVLPVQLAQQAPLALKVTQVPKVPSVLQVLPVPLVPKVHKAHKAHRVLKVTQAHKALLAPLDLRVPKALLDKTVKTVLMARVSPLLALSLTKPHSPLV